MTTADRHAQHVATGALAGALLLEISFVPPLLTAAAIALLVALAYVPFARRQA
jgi:hypothetical protein